LQSISIFPNPAQSQLQVQNNEEKLFRFCLYNMAEIKLYEVTIDKPHFTLDVSEYPKGLYFIELHNRTSTTKQHLVIN
tara:strand:- start:11713 stop:11946 length:234 start_codon:yes stop_codon:yes gene_type:complete